MGLSFYMNNYIAIILSEKERKGVHIEIDIYLHMLYLFNAIYSLHWYLLFYLGRNDKYKAQIIHTVWFEWDIFINIYDIS